MTINVIVNKKTVMATAVASVLPRNSKASPQITKGALAALTNISGT